MTSPAAKSVSSRGRVTAALVGLLVLLLAGWLVKGATDTDDHGPRDSGLRTERLSALPPQAAQTWRLISSGGPFPYPDRDGTVFANREGLLPAEDRGYYHEYTVPTPERADRGARRLITGGPGELYYTADHYDSFVAVDPEH